MSSLSSQPCRTVVFLALSFCLTSFASEIQINTEADGFRVGVLSNYNPSKWSDTAPCWNGSSTKSNLALIKCNLQGYAAAVAAAKIQRVSLLVVPEGYGLGSETVASDYYEPFNLDSAIGTLPCSDGDGDGAGAGGNASQPELFALSCAAKSSMAIAANIFTIDAVYDRHITEVVFDNRGVIISAYYKHHLFVSEEKDITPGPFKPTSFNLTDAMNRSVGTIGIVICYEGIYPTVTGDWSQFDTLVHTQHATTIVWSVGGTVGTLIPFAEKIAKKYNVTVLASEQFDVASPSRSAGIIDGGGKALSGTTDTYVPSLTNVGYTGKPFVRHGLIPFQ